MDTAIQKLHPNHIICGRAYSKVFKHAQGKEAHEVFRYLIKANIVYYRARPQREWPSLVIKMVLDTLKEQGIHFVTWGLESNKWEILSTREAKIKLSQVS